MAFGRRKRREVGLAAKPEPPTVMDILDGVPALTPVALLERCLSIDRVAIRLGCDVKTVRAIEKKDMWFPKPFTIGPHHWKNKRYDLQQIDAWIEQKKHEAKLARGETPENEAYIEDIVHRARARDRDIDAAKERADREKMSPEKRKELLREVRAKHRRIEEEAPPPPATWGRLR